MHAVNLPDEGYEWLVGLLTKYHHKQMVNPAAYELAHIEMVNALIEAFENHEYVKDKKIREVVSTPKTPRTAPTALRDGCADHPLYQAKRRPRTACGGCWQAFKTYNPNSYTKARREFDRAAK